jgi:hypothetical protein
MIIEDGSGTGRKAKVSLENQLQVDAVTKTLMAHASLLEQSAFSLVFSQISNGGAGDCILYMKNLDIKPLIISQLWASVTVADTIFARYGMTGTPSGGTTPVPVNLNTGSAATANGLFHQHTVIGGLAGGTVMFRSYFTANAISQRLYFDDAFVLTQNGVWTLHVTTAAANTVSGQVLFFFHEIP